MGGEQSRHLYCIRRSGHRKRSRWVGLAHPAWPSAHGACCECHEHRSGRESGRQQLHRATGLHALNTEGDLPDRSSTTGSSRRNLPNIPIQFATLEIETEIETKISNTKRE